MEENKVVEEINGKDELAREVESLNELAKKDFEEIINSKLEEDKNFTLEPLTDEEKSKLTSDEVEEYEIGLKLFEDKDKVIDPFTIIPERLLSEDDKRMLETIKSGVDNKKALEDFKETIRYQYILSAINIYNAIIQERFSKEVQKLQNNTSPEEVIDYFFTTNNENFGFNPETMQVSYNEDTKDKNLAYSHTVLMDKMIALSNDPKFLSRLEKQCKDSRYKRHLEDLNYLLKKKLQYTNGSLINVDLCERIIKTIFFRKFKIDIYEVDKITNMAISRAYVIAMSELAKKAYSNHADFVELYYYNANLNMLAQTKKYSDLKGSAKLAFDGILEFITNIYIYYKK